MKHYLMEQGCPCGKAHTAAIDEIITGKGVLSRIPEVVSRFSAKKPFVLADIHTYAAAGEKVCAILKEAGISYSSYIFQEEALEPDEKAVGSAVLHFDSQCDLVIAVGSGVINDIGKIISNVHGCHYVIVGTAPSMDGYASASSSMSRDGLKISLNSRCADVIIGDTDVLKNAPDHLLKAGLGDMLAKYISIAEWRIAHIITGEYYCEEVAQLIRTAVKKCVDNAEGLLKHDEEAIAAVFEGLVIGGVAMTYAGVSRPASGVEHYFSHVWDMRGLALGTKVDLHGIQCALGTLEAAKVYEKIKTVTPDAAKAKAYVDAFCFENWADTLRGFIGAGAETMIAQEAKERKYDKAAHGPRFAVIEAHWDEIVQIINDEIPSAARIRALLETIGIEPSLTQLDIDEEAAKLTFKATKDIRDKYVLSRLAWDLGVLDEMCQYL